MKIKSFKLSSICISVAVFITSQIPTLPAKSGIFDVFGRCGSAGEGHVTVTNNLRTTVYVLTDKNDKAGGPDGAELAPGQSNRTPICNRNGLRAKVYTSTKCGKTFLSESRFSRVYNEEFVSIKPSGFAFRIGDILDVGSRIGGVALTYIAAGYGIPPEALSALGVNEAEVTGACLKGGIGCASAIYKYKDKLPSDLLTTINADKCLATILQPSPSSVSAPVPVPEGQMQKPSQTTTTLPPQVSQVPSDSSPTIGVQRVFIKSAHGNFFLNHTIGNRSISLADKPYDPATGAYDGELWEIVDAGGGRVIIKSARGNYFLNHTIGDKSISLADKPYDPATGAYDGELWQIVKTDGNRVIIKSAHGNYFLNHTVGDRSISLVDQLYNPLTGAYNGELWEIVAR